MPFRYAVIPTYGRECLIKSVQAISDQIDHLFIIAHNWQVPDGLFNSETVTVIPYWAELPNISTMWNLGLEAAESRADGEEYFVAVINDDAIVPPDWFSRLSEAMAEHGASAGSVARLPGLEKPILYKKREPINWKFRMAGYAFMLNGSHFQRANEMVRWYFTDDVIDFEARDLGGTLVIPEPQINHLYPGQSTHGKLAMQAREDRKTFYKLYGMLPQ